MSFYNMMNGVNPATFFITPMLGERHPDTYPRFRDCFVDTENGKREIQIYTRVGGGNRDEGYGEEELYKHQNFLRTYDDDFDSTYGYYVFSVPTEWEKDFDLIVEGKIKEISPEYKERLYKVFPKLKGTFDKLFNSEPGVEGCDATKAK
jgi:hypothetical protein